MDNLLHKLRKQESNLTRTDKKFYSRKIITGSIIGVFIAATPFIFYSFEYVPDEKVWDTFLFTYKSGYYESARIGIWIAMMKIVPLLLLFIWFFTCRHWWYHTLLVPIAMYTYQLFSTINDEIAMVDKFQLIYLVPLMAIIVPSIYLLRARMFDKLNYVDKSFEELEQEFMIKPTTFWGKVKQYF